MSSCKQWGVPEGFFQGLCVKKYDPLQGTDECSVCVTPTSRKGQCNSCSPPPAYAYRIGIESYPYSVPSTAPSGNTYNDNTWNLFNTSACVWSSEEPELGVGEAGFPPAVTLVSVTSLNNGYGIEASAPASRFRLVLNTETTGVSWTLEVKYRTAMSTLSGGTVDSAFIRQYILYYKSQTVPDCYTVPEFWNKLTHSVVPAEVMINNDPLFLPSPWQTNQRFIDLSNFITFSPVGGP